MTAILQYYTGQRPERDQKIPVLTGEEKVRRNSKESEDTVMEAILQRHFVDKAVEHGIQAGIRQN